MAHEADETIYAKGVTIRLTKTQALALDRSIEGALGGMENPALEVSYKQILNKLRKEARKIVGGVW